jgi:hypothetical protein
MDTIALIKEKYILLSLSGFNITIIILKIKTIMDITTVDKYLTNDFDE